MTTYKHLNVQSTSWLEQVVTRLQLCHRVPTTFLRAAFLEDSL